MMTTLRKSLVLIVLALSIVLAGCGTLLPPMINVTTGPTGNVAVEIENVAEDASVIAETEDTDKEMQETPSVTEAAPTGDENLPRKTVTEGDIVSFPSLQATDPDGDPITYTFTPPLDEEGQWQTKVGDAGEYRITITASDGKNSVSQVVIIQVNPKNRAPEIKLASKEIRIKEGETVSLNVQATDPDGDKVTLTFEGWMTSQTRQTTFEDAGLHEVELVAFDGTATTRETVRVIVENTNRAPKISPINDIIIKEGDKITVNPTATDPDGDAVSYSYTPPVNNDGTWQTSRQDVGKYRVNITASDGSLSETTSFLVVVESLNQAPAIQISDLITVEEGQTVTLQPTITDNEGDELTITYSGWMNSNSYTTTFEDAGSHLVTITVSDGINTAKKDVTVMVNDVNRAPTFGAGAFS
jgi:hypothetical protein